MNKANKRSPTAGHPPPPESTDPATQTGSPATQTGSPATQTGSPATQTASPATQAGAPTPQTEPPAIRADTLTVARGPRTVLRGLDFTVPRGQVTGLLGPSGCGKSTLMRAVVGTQAKVTGALTVLGHSAGSPALRSRIGYVTQDPSVYDDLTVRQNLDYFAAVLDPGRGAAAARRHDQVGRVLDDVALTSHADSLAGNLSGGQRSRVSLAVALLGAPELLVLDEPTVGLDPVLRRDLWNLFHAIADRGATLLVSSHVMDEAERCHRLLLMREGELLADDTPEALRARTRTDTVEAAFLHLVDAADTDADTDADTGAAHTADAAADAGSGAPNATPAAPRSPR
ncbi:ATP-binding cassette domain-containing protein [Streptomyces sp. NPDC005865]|uniref:ABC transporter ATP-binding protein n=1 Tax=Streptomyces sp. NPDC005865 TaxID=3155453 RepID=UPI0033E864B6